MADALNNTGDYNAGHHNAGHYNTGDRNAGCWNAGGWNTGDYNAGHHNTGGWNTGDRNAGCWNTGGWNTGDRNAGDHNTGDHNTGRYNAGHYNTGDRNTGFFCTATGPVRFFDADVPGMTWSAAYALLPWVDLPRFACEWVPPADMTFAEKEANPSHKTTGGYLRKHELTIQQSFPLAWAKMDAATRQKFLDLPNFDAEKFLTCTGVDVRKPTSLVDIWAGEEVTINGLKYRRVG